MDAIFQAVDKYVDEGLEIEIHELETSRKTDHSFLLSDPQSMERLIEKWFVAFDRREGTTSGELDEQEIRISLSD